MFKITILCRSCLVPFIRTKSSLVHSRRIVVRKQECYSNRASRLAGHASCALLKPRNPPTYWWSSTYWKLYFCQYMLDHELLQWVADGRALGWSYPYTSLYVMSHCITTANWTLAAHRCCTVQIIASGTAHSLKPLLVSSKSWIEVSWAGPLCCQKYPGSWMAVGMALPGPCAPNHQAVEVVSRLGHITRDWHTILE